MENLYLPKGFKKELRKIWGNPLFGGKKDVLKDFKTFCRKRKLKKIIMVGDCCSINLPADVKIFDGRIKRRKIKNLTKFSLTCSNSPGTIQKEVWSVIKRAIKNNENVFIKGEEDLLVIPAILLSEKNTAVIYGFPGKGICLIEVNSQTKKIFREMLKKFKTK